MTDTVTDWDSRVAWMRARGIIQASWSVDGSLTMALLGPEPMAPGDEKQLERHEEPTMEEMLLASA